MPAPPFAHLGHWYVSLPIFMGPVLLIAIALKIQTWRESHKGPDTSGKRSTVATTTQDDQTATIAIAGPLDYPALVELESALGTLPADVRTVTLDLRRITTADQEAAWSLCDAIGRAARADTIGVVLDPASPDTEIVSRTLLDEGVDAQLRSGPVDRPAQLGGAHGAQVD